MKRKDTSDGSLVYNLFSTRENKIKKKKKEEKKPNLPSLYNSFQVDSSDAILYNGQVH